MKTLLADQIIDPDTEVHFAIHQTFQQITEIHAHDFYEIVFIASGELLHIINNQTQLLKEGHLLFIRPNDQHYYKKYNNSPVQLINLAFTQSTVHNLFTFLGKGFSESRITQASLPPISVLKQDEIESLMLKIHKCVAIPPSLKEEIKTMLRSLLAELLIQYFSANYKTNLSPIPDWLDHIEFNMRDKENFRIGLPKLYELSSKSPEHLSRTIKKHFNKTPTQWINDFRLNYAANLLIYTDETILNIILESGFENTSHFYHLFKTKFSLSPAKYRKNNSRNIIPH